MVDDVEAANLIFFCLRPAIDTDLNSNPAAGIPGLVDRFGTADVITFTWQNGLPVCFQQMRITFPLSIIGPPEIYNLQFAGNGTDDPPGIVIMNRIKDSRFPEKQAHGKKI